MTARSLPLVFVAACVFDAQPDVGDTDDTGGPGGLGGQSGSLVPEMCVEVDRITVTDSTEVPPGASESLADIEAAMAGAFAGSFGTLPLTLDLVRTGDAEFVTIEPDDSSTGGTGVGAPDVPDTMCPLYQWEVPVDAAFAALPDFDEAGPSVLWVRGLDLGGWGLALDQGEVGGASRPDWDTSEYDQTTLRISGAYDGTQWHGSLSWSSSTTSTSTGSGGAEGSGVIEPEQPWSATRVE